MPVITAMERHRRKKERVRLFLDDDFAFELPLMEAARLQPGQHLSADEVAGLLEMGALQNVLDRALRFLAYRPRSMAELRRYLVAKEVAAPLLELALERLQAQGYLDDAAFARFWIADRERFKPLSPRGLRYELRQKGVDDALIEAALAEVDAAASAYRAAAKRLPRYRGASPEEFRQKLGGLLQRRGFDRVTINEALLRLRQELEESEPGYFRAETEPGENQ